MECLKILFIIMFLFFFTSCAESEGKQELTSQLDFPQATKIAKEYLIKSKNKYLSKLNVLEDLNNEFWNAYSSPYSEMLEDYGLKDKDYYAVMFIEGVRDGGVIVFVDKNEKKVIGVLYGTQYKKISPSDI